MHLAVSYISKGNHTNETREHLPPPSAASKETLYYFIQEQQLPAGLMRISPNLC